MCRQYGTYIRMCYATPRHGQRVDAATAVWNEKGTHVERGGEALPITRRKRGPRVCAVCGVTRISTHVTVCNTCNIKEKKDTPPEHLRAVGVYEHDRLVGIRIVGGSHE